MTFLSQGGFWLHTWIMQHIYTFDAPMTVVCQNSGGVECSWVLSQSNRDSTDNCVDFFWKMVRIEEIWGACSAVSQFRLRGWIFSPGFDAYCANYRMENYFAASYRLSVMRSWRIVSCWFSEGNNRTIIIIFFIWKELQIYINCESTYDSYNFIVLKFITVKLLKI